MVDKDDLQESVTCPECDNMGYYQGIGRTSVSNWGGKTYSVYRCRDCELTYYVEASHLDSPTFA